jgi:hypothetical protein
LATAQALGAFMMSAPRPETERLYSGPLFGPLWFQGADLLPSLRKLHLREGQFTVQPLLRCDQSLLFCQTPRSYEGSWLESGRGFSELQCSIVTRLCGPASSGSARINDHRVGMIMNIVKRPSECR